MKKIIILILMFSISSIGYSQVGEYRNNMCIGFNAGFTMNKIGFDPIIAQKYHTAPTFGITFRYTSERFLTAYCALQVELNYMRLGWTEEVFDSNSQPLPDSFKSNLDYLQIPFLTRLAWGKEKKGAMFYILLGPQIGYCISENKEFSEQWTLIEGTNIPNRPNNLHAQYDLSIKNKFDYGITGGVGLEVNTTLGHFLIEGRYYYGLSDIFGNSKKDTFSRSNHGAIIAKLTYLFDIN